MEKKKKKKKKNKKKKEEEEEELKRNNNRCYYCWNFRLPCLSCLRCSFKVNIMCVAELLATLPVVAFPSLS